MQLPLRSFDNAAEISVVIPVCNEEGNVRPLYAELLGVLEKIGCPWEICFVDDGSQDGTWDQLLAVAAECSRVKLVRFARNFGQSTALAAGIRATTGDVVVTLDGDLQNDPTEIPRMLALLREGYDVVHGRRLNRQDAFWTRWLPSLAANWLVRRVTGTSVHDLGCSLRAMRRELAERLVLVGEMHRYIPVLADALGANSIELPVGHRPRSFGRTKYGLRRTFRVLRDLAILASLPQGRRTPMKSFSRTAIASALLGIVFLCFGLANTAGSATWRAASLVAAEVAELFSLLIWNLGLVAEQWFLTAGWEKQTLPLCRVVSLGGQKESSLSADLDDPAEHGELSGQARVIRFPQASSLSRAARPAAVLPQPETGS